MPRETRVGRVEHLVVTKENSATDWVVAALSNNDPRAPEWYALELSHRTPTSLALFNVLRDAQGRGDSVRLVVNRDDSVTPSWQRAVVVAVESPRLPQAQRFV